MPLHNLDIGDWLVEPRLCQISRAGRAIHLRPKLMDLLMFLASKQGEVVGKEQILEQVWRGEFVVESVLGRSIADLRQTLEDDVSSPRFIETIPRRGYRLVAPVRRREAAARLAGEPSIAVLPFADMSFSGDQQYFCDGLAEELTNSLCGIPGLRVIARTSAFAFRGATINIREIGRQLNVASVLEGAVQRVDGQVRITVQLVDTDEGCHLWSRRFDRAAGEVFALQDEIAQAVVSELRARLRLDDEKDRVRRRTENPDAHDSYLRGSYISPRRTPAALEEAAAYFQRAIASDPDYAVAHAALAECHGVGAFLGYCAPGDGYSKAIAAAHRAVQIDPMLAEGHAVLAACLTFYGWQWKEAERGFRRAIELSPSYSVAHVWYSHLLAALGRTDEALDEAHCALRLDPLSPTVRVCVGLRFADTHRFDPAIEQWQATLAMDPDFALAHLHLGRTYWVMGRLDDALVHLQRAAPSFPLALGYLGGVLGRAGRRREATEVLGQLERLSAERYVGAVAFALVHQGMGDHDTALDWYTNAFDAHEGVLVLFLLDPVLDPLRTDPRFAALLRRLQLPE